MRCKVFIDYQFLFAFVGSGREQTSTRFLERLSRVSITVRGKRDSSYFYFFTKKTPKNSTAKNTFMFEKSGNTSYLVRPESSTGGFYLFALPAYATKILNKLNSHVDDLKLYRIYAF